VCPLVSIIKITKLAVVARKFGFIKVYSDAQWKREMWVGYTKKMWRWTPGQWFEMTHQCDAASIVIITCRKITVTFRLRSNYGRKLAMLWSCTLRHCLLESLLVAGCWRSLCIALRFGRTRAVMTWTLNDSVRHNGLSYGPGADTTFHRTYFWFLIFVTARNAGIASAVLATAIPSVRPSVTRRYYVKTTARSTVQFALSDSIMVLVL